MGPTARAGAPWVALLAWILLAAAPAQVQAGLIRKGPEPFAVSDLATWKGRIVRRIDYQGRKVTREHVVTREIHTTVGAPLDLRVLDEDLQRLQNLSVFSDIRVDAVADGADGVDLAFVFKESPSYLPLISVIYTEENGFSVGPTVSALNVAGLGLRGSGSAYFGGTTQYWASVDWPWAYGKNHDSVGLALAHRERPDELRGFFENSDEATAKLGRYFGTHGRGSLNVSYLRMRSNEPGITLEPDDEDHLFRLGFSLGIDTRDSWRNPRSGWQNQVQVWRTSAFWGDGDSWLVDLDLRRWIPTAPRQKLLLSSLLTLQSGTLGVDVPTYLDYYMGGANSIRGYGVTQLGTPFSGKNQLLGTAEYSFTLMPVRRWDVAFLSFAVGAELAVFGDAGIAWNESQEFGLRRSRGGMGCGFRLLVPGSEMVRLDVGWSPTGGFHFHLASGTKPDAQRRRLR
jgi:outer membrane protein insertion porin family